MRFVGLCTHMADAANSTTAKYTRRQFSRFAKVVRELRARGVHVPMVHVENSEALLSEQVATEKIRQLTAPMMMPSPRNSSDVAPGGGGGGGGWRTRRRILSSLSASLS